MPVYKISASADYTVPPNAKSSGAINNRGSATRVGTASANISNVAVSRPQTTVFGSTVIDGADADPAFNATTIAYSNQRPIGMRVSSTLAGQAKTALLSGADVPGLFRSIAKREAYKVAKVGTATRSGHWDAYKGKYMAYGSYTRSAFTVTATVPNHGLITDDFVKLDFTSGAATDGRFQVTVVNANTFSVTHGTSGTTSGNVVMMGPAYAVESVNSDTAATPSLSSPGQLTYRTGAKLPVTTNDYKSKTVW